MYKQTVSCKREQRIGRHRLTIALKQDRWQKFQPVLKKKWQGSFTSWLEYAMECYSRDTCKGCPYEADDDDREKAPDGIAKVVDKDK